MTKTILTALIASVAAASVFAAEPAATPAPVKAEAKVTQTAKTPATPSASAPAKTEQGVKADKPAATQVTPAAKAQKMSLSGKHGTVKAQHTANKDHKHHQAKPAVKTPAAVQGADKATPAADSAVKK